MSRIHILSNRLPFSVKNESGEFCLEPSVGGLATGLKSVYKSYNGTWIGWSGIVSDSLDAVASSQVEELLNKEACATVPLSQEDIELYYEGFSNKTIWPLFHYFTQRTEYNEKEWGAYEQVNRKFADRALSVLEPGDTIWIHDYQLFLVPQLIKERMPTVTIGFFLHIPFPSFEIFRQLPWRMELINGILGSDLIGFHTYDYERHFLSSVRRLLGYEIILNKIFTSDRVIMVDAFPMGIDFDRFNRQSFLQAEQTPMESSDFHQELNAFMQQSPNRKLILSIDRLDYTKGIPHRLKAFRHFLQSHPEYHQKVTLIMLAVPSRDNVEQYQILKKEVDELVGNINGVFGSINYTPIWYFYRSLPFEDLVSLYRLCDVLMVTPVRDGMNLVAKEYVASRTQGDGVLVLSEMAGVAKEMSEALIVNPNNETEMSLALFQALEMTPAEQKQRMAIIQQRIKRYDVFKWADDFVEALFKVQALQNDLAAKKITTSIRRQLVERYNLAQNRALFLDFDGTLVPFHKDPQAATPDSELLEVLERLCRDNRNHITIISGRDKVFLEKHLGHLPVNMIAEHGIWHKQHHQAWNMPSIVNNTWIPDIRPILESFVDRTPGTFIETKGYSLVWHYRNAEPEQAEKRANELKDALTHFIANLNIEIMEGNKVIEVKNGGINKGVAALQILGQNRPDFLLAAGDDWTDEYMFRELPDHTISIKVGLNRTRALYKIESVKEMRSFLKELAWTLT